MPIRVTCPNPDCKAAFRVAPQQTRDTVWCPHCGKAVRLRGRMIGAFDGPLEFGDDDGQGAAGGSSSAGGGAVHHPGRLTCSNCGAVLGVRDAFCPSCGADVRTGQAILAAPKKKKRNLKPFIIGGVAVVVIIVLAIVVPGMMKGGGDKPEAEPQAQAQQPAQPAAEQVVAVPAEPEPEQASAPPPLELSAETVAQLRAASKAAQDAVDAYRDRLKAAFASMANADANETARLWADLYTFCRDKGLQAEAEQCWERAARLRPTDAAVNQTLGRTATYEGVPVTPEQKQFLDTLKPRLRLVNYDPDLSDHQLSVAGRGPKAFEGGSVAEFTVEPGPVKVEVTRTSQPDRPVAAFTVDVDPALVYTLEMRKPAAAPPVPYDELLAVYQVVAGAGAAAEGVEVERDGEGNIVRASAGALTVSAEPGTPLQMRAGGGGLTVVGHLYAGNPFTDGGQQVVFGSSRNPVRLAVDDTQRAAVLRGGTYCILRLDMTDGLWGVLATAQGDFATEWARRKLAARLDDIGRENARLEANGELLGAWQARVRTDEQLKECYDEAQAALAVQDRAAARPAYLDRARACGAGNRVEWLYMNWPRYRQALVKATAGAQDAVMDCLATMVEGGASAPRRAQVRAAGAAPQRVRRLSPREAMRRAIGGRSGAEVAATQVRHAETADASLQPARVELSEDEQLLACISILPVFSDQAAVDFIADGWANLDNRARSVALRVLEQVGTPEAVEFLGRLTQESGDAAVVSAAFVSLGIIGTPEALAYCNRPVILPEVRAAGMVAKALAGDVATLDGLQAFLDGGDATVTQSFLNYATGHVVTPSAFLLLSQAVDAYSESGSRLLIAKALAHIGGHAANAELARLMAKSSQAFPEALPLVDAQDAVLLIEPVGNALVGGTGGAESAKFLVQNGSDAAFEYLKAAASSGSLPAIEALLDTTTSRGIEAAAVGAHAVDLALLSRMRAAWYTVDELTGDADWQPGVDSQAPRYFLEKVLESVASDEARLGAAVMLREIGQTPSADALLALAGSKAVLKQPSPQPRGRRRGRRIVAEQYNPAGFVDPVGVPEAPEGLRFTKGVAIHALGLLAETAGENTAARVRELASTYKDWTLRAAALRVVGILGGEEDRQFLRTAASARAGAYADIDAYVGELQGRMAALGGVGAAQDAAYLPDVLAMLDEPAPDPQSIPGLEEDVAQLQRWWTVRLQTAACRCVAEMCSARPLASLTGDSSLQQRLVARLVSIIQTTALQAEDMLDATMALRVAAVKAFGRAADVTQENRLVVEQLAQALRRTSESSGPRGVRGAVARSRTAQAAQEESAPLRAALLDAATCMAARDPNAEDLLTLIDEMLADGTLKAGWNNVIRGLAANPTDSFVELVRTYFPAVRPEVRRAVLANLREQRKADAPYVSWAVAMVTGAPGGTAGGIRAVRRERQRGPAGLSAEQRAAETARVQSEMEAQIRAAEMADGVGLEADDGLGPPPAGVMGVPEQEESGRTGRRTPRRTMGAREETALDRTVERRYAKWAYSITKLGAEATRMRQRWELIRELFAGRATLSSSRLSELADSEFGPAVAAVYAEKNAAESASIVGRLGEALLGKVGAGDVPRMRAVVAALRRIGTEAAADALYLGLVGPQVQAAAVPGMPPGVSEFEPPPGVMVGAGAGSGDRGAVAFYIARALGSMGRGDMLRAALSAAAHKFFRADSGAVVGAALNGMAYLPAANDPVRALQGLLRAAGPQQVGAVSEAIVTALRNMAAD